MSWADLMRELEWERIDVSYLKHEQRAREDQKADTPERIKLRRLAAEKRD